MTGRTIWYRTGNENNPSDPFGRSELVLQADGSARLGHHFSRSAGRAPGPAGSTPRR